MVAGATILLPSCVRGFASLVPLLDLLLHANLEQHLLLSQVLLLAHVLLLTTHLLSAFWLHHLLLSDLLLVELLLSRLICIVLFELLH